MAKKMSKKFTDSVVRISNLGDFILNDDKHSDWEIDKIELTSKNNPTEKIVCSWERVNGKWVHVCRRA
jgi:hypothetical protein